MEIFKLSLRGTLHTTTKKFFNFNHKARLEFMQDKKQNFELIKVKNFGKKQGIKSKSRNLARAKKLKLKIEIPTGVADRIKTH